MGSAGAASARATAARRGSSRPISFFAVSRDGTPTTQEASMIDHLSIGVRDVARAKRFYDAALAPLGYKCLSAGEGSLGYGDAAVMLWIGAAEGQVPGGEKSGLAVGL